MKKDIILYVISVVNRQYQTFVNRYMHASSVRLKGFDGNFLRKYSFHLSPLLNKGEEGHDYI